MKIGKCLDCGAAFEKTNSQKRCPACQAIEYDRYNRGWTGEGRAARSRAYALTEKANQALDLERRNGLRKLMGLEEVGEGEA